VGAWSVGTAVAVAVAGTAVEVAVAGTGVAVAVGAATVVVAVGAATVAVAVTARVGNSVAVPVITASGAARARSVPAFWTKLRLKLASPIARATVSIPANGGR